MDNSTCQACSKTFNSESSLHKHIKIHNLLIADYYQNYWPRYDKFSHELIRFRNKAQYFSTDFNSRINLKSWLESAELSVVRAYCKSLLEARKDKKALIWTPSQVELRTTMLPPIQFYDKVFDNYYSLCEEVGLKNRFNPYSRVLALSNRNDRLKIIVDTREQLPLEFPSCDTERAALKFGDYACTDGAYTCDLHVERKSPPDFVGTFSGGFDRFSREMDRSVAAKAYMVVLVEDTLSNCLRFNYTEHYHRFGSRVNSEFIFNNVRALIQKYENLQFLFVNGREEAAKIIERLFRSNCTYKDVDLQLLYDRGEL